MLFVELCLTFNWIGLVDRDLDLIRHLLDHVVRLWDFDFLLDGVWNLLEVILRIIF